ncbi:hypothetical protein [Sphingomonas crusticola]|uniref:hypothetical protein n=1 Tax=Sphingomonas crusticola TaxID=1697973 RepID=UPI000E23906F|nr:hypothetical protein [Sphingomonas crusticola]
MSILIISMPNDIHALSVKWAVERLGERCEIFYPFDLSGGAEWVFDPAAEALQIRYRSERTELRFDDFRSVWMRRPPARIPQEDISDQHERGVSEVECGILLASVLNRIETGRFTVSPLDAMQRASLKPFQMRVASELGLQMPRSIISNARDEIVQFFHACGERMIYKPLKPALWLSDVDRYSTVPTTIFTDTRLLTAGAVQKSPAIFQEVIDKQTEVRATIMGRSIFAWEKSFPNRSDQDVDWRFMYKGATHARHDLPEFVQVQCFRLMEALGLVFGCFDFAIDRDGNYIFLEVNPQGNWLWGDEMLGLFQLQAMAEFLISGQPDFTYSGRQSFRLCDYDGAEYDAVAQREKMHHHGDLMTSLYGSVSVPWLPPQSVVVA